MANPVAPTRKAGTVGLPLPITEVRVVDPDEPDGRRGAGEPRASCIVRGPQVFSGYWKKPEETAAVFVAAPTAARRGSAPATSSRSTPTASCASSTASRSSSSPAASTSRPSEVEEALRAHPDVDDVAVVGLPDERTGEQVVAAVVLRDGRDLRRGGDPRVRPRRPHAPTRCPSASCRSTSCRSSLIGKVLRREVRNSLLNE